MKVVLVATDGSEGGTAALREAADFASTHDAELVVLTVMTRSPGLGSVSDELRDYAAAEHLQRGVASGIRHVGENILAEAKSIVEDWDNLKASYISRAGDPAEEIIACAREHSADTLFLGSRGLGPMGSFILGSVSRKVAHAAGCTVKIASATEDKPFP